MKKPGPGSCSAKLLLKITSTRREADIPVRIVRQLATVITGIMVLSLLASVAVAASNVLNFDGLQNGEPIADYYNGGKAGLAAALDPITVSCFGSAHRESRDRLHGAERPARRHPCRRLGTSRGRFPEQSTLQ